MVVFNVVVQYKGTLFLKNFKNSKCQVNTI